MDKIHIEAKKAQINDQCTIKISQHAAEVLMEILNESGRTVRAVASDIIIQAVENDLIIFDREE